MKTVLKIIGQVVDFFFNLILPADAEMEMMRTLDPGTIFGRLRHVSGQKYPGVFAIFSYQDKLVRKMIWQMKFRECRWVSEIFGKFLADNIARVIAGGFVGALQGTSLNNEHRIVLVPTPLHPKRFSERGYNQCEWLCEAIVKNLNAKMSAHLIYDKKILRRMKYRTKQSWSSRADRFRNAENIFATSDGAGVAGRTFILIDDVVTTGATLNEARRTLLAAGASNVICFVIAH